MQAPANVGTTTMGFIAIAFIALTVGMLVATAGETVRRLFGRRAA